MSLRWFLLVLLVAYGVSVFAAVENFNELVHEAVRDQHTLEAELQNQLGINNEKTLGFITENDSVAPKSFKIRLIK